MEPLVLIFLIITGIQVVYLLAFITGFARYRNAKGSGSLPVSVVVAARNEEENLKMLLPKLQSQDHPDFEVIVVLDRPEDGSAEYISEISRTDNRFRSVVVDDLPKDWDGKKYAVTKGVEAAHNEVIVLTDADCVPSSDHWLSSMSKVYDDTTEIVLGYSAYQKRAGFLNKLIRFETMYTAIQYLSFALLGNPYMGVGRNLSYRKSLFLKKGGLEAIKGLTGGDDDLFVNRNGNRLNTKVVLGKESLTLSKPKTSWKKYFVQKKRHLSAGRYYRSLDKILLGLYSFTILSFWAIFIILSLPGTEPILTWGGFFIRFLLFHLTFAIAGRAIGDPLKLWSVAVLEFTYIIYYWIPGVAAGVSKTTKWS